MLTALDRGSDNVAGAFQGTTDVSSCCRYMYNTHLFHVLFTNFTRTLFSSTAHPVKLRLKVQNLVVDAVHSCFALSLDVGAVHSSSPVVCPHSPRQIIEIFPHDGYKPRRCSPFCPSVRVTDLLVLNVWTVPGVVPNDLGV
jgi:hypothetical protein